MTCICDIELYKELINEDFNSLLYNDEIDFSFNSTLDILLNINENGEIEETEELFPQPKYY